MIRFYQKLSMLLAARELVEEANAILRCRLMAHQDPTKTVEDGTYRLEDGTVAHIQEERLHREGEPAITRPDGTRAWYRIGRLDRENGPAVQYRNGTGEWYRAGRWYYGSKRLKAFEDGIFKVEQNPGPRP